MRVVVATLDDIPAWLDLAGEVELPYFGPLLESPEFRAALRRAVEEGRAYCAREADGPAGSPLKGGLLLGIKPTGYRIGWLAVSGRWRRQGVGRLLVGQALAPLPPAEVSVVTYAEGVDFGVPARRFYESMGFRPAEPHAPTPNGVPCQVFRKPV